jgi:hypothetical protein
MPNDPQADLIYAILALDSYNRGYGSAISGLSAEGENATFGGFRIIRRIPGTQY